MIIVPAQLRLGVTRAQPPAPGLGQAHPCAALLPLLSSSAALHIGLASHNLKEHIEIHQKQDKEIYASHV